MTFSFPYIFPDSTVMLRFLMIGLAPCFVEYFLYALVTETAGNGFLRIINFCLRRGL